jgi:nucleotide-binding universal stress UspA family protein
MFRNILVASHGTPGARQAESMAASLARECGAALTVLSIVNIDWNVMTGDDWLNSSATRNHFANYVEGEIQREVSAVWERIQEEHPDLSPHFVRKVGELEDALVDAAAEAGADLIVVGARQKTRTPGFKARLKGKKLHPRLDCPLLVAP